MLRRHWITIVVVVIAGILFLLATRSASGVDARRGQALYDTRCGGCHSESVHGRAKRMATDFEAVRRWVERWNESLGARWGREEVEDVTVYLNDTYYRFSCPPSVCKVVSIAPSQ